MIPYGQMCICRSDDRRLSNCHNAPVYVCLGEVTFGEKRGDWSQAIDRYCTVCEGKVDVHADCHEGPGTEFAKRIARCDVATSNPEKT